MFSIVNDKGKLVRILSLAKSAIRHNMSEDISAMRLPTCLIWGKQDNITPPEVAEEFKRLPRQRNCIGSTNADMPPMMEQPVDFNRILDDWLEAPGF